VPQGMTGSHLFASKRRTVSKMRKTVIESKKINFFCQPLSATTKETIIDTFHLVDLEKYKNNACQDIPIRK
jgi:hypothetical protein